MRSTITHFTSRLALAIALAATLASCSKDDASGDRLPEGECPMTFTAAMDGLTAEKAATRATSGNTWTGGEQVAMQIDEVVKKYTVTDAMHGTLVAASGVEPWYWQSTADIDVTAWYPYNSGVKPTTFSVIQNQFSANAYQASDLIFASQSVTFSNPSLTFKHLPVKVVANLKAGNGVDENGVKNATVRFVNQAITSGAITDDWSVQQATVNTDKIITPNLQTPPSGYQRSVQALLVPQQMHNKQFIKVTIVANNVSRDYYYTPPTENDANLTAGNQYTFTITVTKNGITVTVSNSTTDWTAAGSPIDVTSKNPIENFTASDLKIGDYYYSDGTYSDGGYRKYSDNATEALPIMPVLTDNKGNERTVVGIVFSVGKHQTDDSDYSSTGIGEGDLQGYVVALKEVQNALPWERGPNNESNVKVGTSSASGNDWNGYSNQTKIKAYVTTNSASNWEMLHFPAANACALWGTENAQNNSVSYAAPTNSSGWFLPSLAQLKYLAENKTTIDFFLKKANGFTLSGPCWSSTEGNDSDNGANVVGSTGQVSLNSKANTSSVRAILAF